MASKPRTRDWLRTDRRRVDEKPPGPFPFAPRGSIIEPAQPRLDFGISEKSEVWADELQDLLNRSLEDRWSLSHDIPWEKVVFLPLEAALSQVLTFLTQLEYVSLYVPSKFLPRINPYFGEAVGLIARHIADEAQHIEAFTRRASMQVGLGYVSVALQFGLKAPYELEDYGKAMFLVNTFCEGASCDILEFLTQVVTDPVTQEIARRVVKDEQRHMSYGLARTRAQMRSRPSVSDDLLRLVEERASFVYASSGADPLVIEALVALAAEGRPPEDREVGTKRVTALHGQMHQMRKERLIQAGFELDTAERVASLYGPTAESGLC